MSSTTKTIFALRQELRMALGTNYPRYMVVMREWFANRHNRLDWEFDMPFLIGNAKELHNRLMLEILQLCMSPNFEARKSTELSTQTQVFLPINESSASKNVLTLHAAPPEEFESTCPVDLHRDTSTFTSIPTPPATSVTTPSNSEDDGPDDLVEESNVNPLFLLGLRKAKKNELNERPMQLRHKGDLRVPPVFLNELLSAGRSEVRSDILPNITHRLNVKKYLDAEPELQQYFLPKQKPGDSFRSSDATLPGKILLKAWEFGIKTIDPQIIAWITKAARDRVLLLIRELIKERKSFRLKPDGHVQFGEFHTNPYLLSRHHFPPCSSSAERRPYSTILVEPIILPPDAELCDKYEQMAALRAATSIDPPYNPPRKISPMDLYLLLRANPQFNLGGVEGQVFLEKLLIKGSGSLEPRRRRRRRTSTEITGKFDLVMDDVEEGQLLPVVSY